MTTAAVAEILGGEKVLGRAVTRSADLAQLVRDGIPAQALVVLAERAGLRQADVSSRFGISQRTLTRRIAQHSKLTAAESDRTVRLARVYAAAQETLGDSEKAAEWLKTPNRALGGVRPLDQLDTDPGVREVEDVLGRIAYGVYS
jgi:putative toxin-antitoxin system antitoxin component (TIGR02293 family)